MRQTLTAITKRSPLYPVYRFFSDRRRKRKSRDFWQWTTEDQTRLDFYQQFVSRGDLVFDIGANLGNRSKIFSKLGAVIVAVEPQTPCGDYLASVFQETAGFHLVRKALGASVGEAEMLICDASTISSLSPDWVRSVTESGRFAEYKWDRAETVSVDTLDNLIDQYGRPAFIKIDVEGFEDEVVAGLSTPVNSLSLEFAPEFMDSTTRCIDHLCRLGEVRFQISVGESMEFALPDWLTADGIKRELSRVSSMTFGDLYARFCS